MGNLLRHQQMLEVIGASKFRFELSEGWNAHRQKLLQRGQELWSICLRVVAANGPMADQAKHGVVAAAFTGVREAATLGRIVIQVDSPK